MTRILGVPVAVAALVTFQLGGCGTGADSNTADFTANGNLKTKVTYDATASKVLISFAEELEDGQALYLTVRRGDLRASDLKAKDCSRVAEQPLAIFGAGQADQGSLGADARAAHGSRTVYQLPLSDESLLVSAYRDADLPAGQSWADGILTPEKQALLDRGIDTFIDVCVTDHESVLRREQVDFFRAWDANNPNIVHDAMAAQATADEFDHNQPRLSSPQKYGELCVAALGEIPFFKNKHQVGTDPVTGRPQYGYDTWSCLDSVHIPATVTVSGTSGEEVSGPDWDLTSGGPPKQCDKRQYIYDLCEQGPRVISARNEQGTEWVLLCRKGEGQTPKLEQKGTNADGSPMLVDNVPHEQLSSKYNDIAMLGYNPSTGRTCFFQNALYSKTDGAHVTHPADIEKSADIWSGVHGESGGINCINCHDNGDPLILSPWISGAKRDDVYAKAQERMSGEGANGWAKDADIPGTPVVPMMGVHPDRPMGESDTPLALVNYLGQGWTHPKKLVGDKAKACTKCHVLGAGNTLQTWALRTVGLDTGYNEMITDAFKKDWKRSHYMPFDPRPDATDPLPTSDAWDASGFATAVQYIKDCRGVNQSDPNGTCTFAEMPRKRAGIDHGGECWSPIPDDCDY